MPATQWSELSGCRDSKALSSSLFHMCGSNPPPAVLLSRTLAEAASHAKVRQLCVVCLGGQLQARWQERSCAWPSPTKEGLAGQWNAGQHYDGHLPQTFQMNVT